MLPELMPDEEISSETTSPTNDASVSFKGLSIRQKNCFLGFEDESSKLRELWQRWKGLEKWIELAVQPINLHPDDRSLLVNDDGGNDGDCYIDDIVRLKKQCLLVQTLFNDHLSTLSEETTRWESFLVVRPSQIPGAGMGLYYEPPPPPPIGEASKRNNTPRNENVADEGYVIPSGSVVCYYTGHVHTHSSASQLEDKSYLMWVRGNTLVDPRCLPHIKARYMNDPLNENLVNCAYSPAKLPSDNGSKTASKPHEDTIRTSVVTLRDISPGEELFVQYGDVYWSKQPYAGNRLVLGGRRKETIGSEENSVSDDEDSDEDIDETFPFSPLFQSKITKPTVWESDS